MAFFDKNISLLKDRFPSVCERLSDISNTSDIEAVAAKQGGVVPSVTAEGKRFFVHSKFDPEKEAERFISEINTAAHDLFIVFGFGFGYHVEKLLKNMGRDSIAVIIEKSAPMLKKAMENRDFSRALADERLILLLDPDEDIIAEALKGKATRRSSLITHRGCFQMYPDYYSNMLGIAKSYLSTKEVNIATLAKFEKVWASNIARNIGAYIKAPGANVFFDKFKGMPAIVVAAGPSLHQSMDFIRQSRDRAVIVAVDTSYKILIRHGIEPHFCIVVDPQMINARYFEGSIPGATILIADPTVHPSVFRLFKGCVAMTGVAFQLMKWIEKVSGDKGEIVHGGSVSTNAYDFARRLGASPVILVGQDLAFTGGYAHARGSYLDEQVHLRTTRLYSPEMFNRFQLTALPKLFVKGIDGQTVHTNQKMMIFLSWFEKRCDPNLINATRCGASIPGVKQMRHGDIILPAQDISPAKRVDEVMSLATGIDASTAASKLLERIRIILDEIDAILPVLSRAVGFSETLLSLTSASGRDQSKMDYVLKKLSETDRIIESKKNAKDMISFTIQRVVHTITEGYEIDESDGGLSEDELVAKRSRYLYNGLLDGARFNSKILKKMACILQNG